MLRRYHGASMLDKASRRLIWRTMATFEGTSPTKANTMTGPGGSPAVKATRHFTSVAHPTPVSPTRVWHPNHGIVFNSPLTGTPGTSRTMITAVAVGSDQDFIEDSSEDGTFYSASSPSSTAGPESPRENMRASSNVVAKAVIGEPNLQSSPPPSEGSFKMSEELFRKAKEAPAGTPESFWSHVLYRGPLQDGDEQRVKVHYCRSMETTERVLKQHFEGKKRLGFDLEWIAQANYGQGVKKNVSLIQLACEDRIALIHIALFPDTYIKCPPTLKKILEDPEVTKIGVAIKSDATRFRKFLRAEPCSLFELSHLHKLIVLASGDFKKINKRLVPLAQLVEEHLHIPLFKGTDVRSSNWDQPLTMEQIVYAAADSYAGLQLFETMEMKRKALDPSPPCPHHIDENKPIRLTDVVMITNEDGDEPEETPAAIHLSKAEAPQGAFETIELEQEASDIAAPKAKPAASTPKSQLIQPPIVLAADAKTQEYRSTNPSMRAAPSSLRAYFIWYDNPTLSILDIAALLREVPLQQSTVRNYILEAIRLEHLPYEEQRLREILELLPEDFHGRYKSLIRPLESADLGE